MNFINRHLSTITLPYVYLPTVSRGSLKSPSFVLPLLYKFIVLFCLWFFVFVVEDANKPEF